MKKWKAILFGTLLTLSLCTFTACGTEGNNADEAVDDKNKNETEEDKTMDNDAENDGVMDNGGIIGDSDTDNNEMSGGNLTVTPEPGTSETGNDGNDVTVTPGTKGSEDAAQNEQNDGTVSGELGDSVKDLGDGVGDAVDDIGKAAGNAVEGK